MSGALLSDVGLSVDELAERLDRTGFVCLENAVSADWLADAQLSLGDYLSTYGESDFCIIQPNNDVGTPAAQFVSDPAVHSLMERLALARCPRGVPEHEEIYSVLRVLAGPERAATSYAYHYDAAVVTILVPLFIPTAGAGRSGELVVFPNRRPFRRSVAVNIVEKFWTQNRVYRRRMTRMFESAPDRYAVVIKPGNAYLLWGYRTLHGNLPCAPGTVRATLLLHFGNPHARSAALAALMKLRRLVAPSSEHTEATVVRL